MWFAILITVLAAAGNNIGKVLQKQATRTLPRLVLNRTTLLLYLRSGLWVTGMLTDLGGALLMIVAFANAPVSVVQPVSGVGLVILLIFSHFYLKERLHWHEWAAACVAFVGVLGLGASAEPDHLEHPDISPWRVLGAFAAMVAALGCECWWRHSTYSHHHGHIIGIYGHGGAGGGGGGGKSPPPLPRSSSLAAAHGVGVGGGGSAGGGNTAASAAAAAAAADAVLCGLEAGACFGFSAAACRTGFILAAKLSVVWVPLGLAASVGLTSAGFLLQTRGLKAGNTVVVCVAAATSSMICGVAAGMLALDEKLPTGHGMKVVRLTSWLCILLGVSCLAGGTQALAATATAVAACVPPWVWRLLPRPVAVSMHRLQKKRALLGQMERMGGGGGGGGGAGSGAEEDDGTDVV
ncbi:hypothetical protein PLESTB_000617400 [Pleodorina starrii]|uniref:Probable magnesium transporter n=1 Tax=Pleodorina starrii TaxID=330485 RepID=A0A9W6F0Z1_9CHLO|nr:hypothetical protein PLESTM_001735500 [Pleodorina starrii]GLC52332.1 hypothetical protein PLESTB_000617400 [Pleodorina starrii]GLC67996.1 hypothetical protein PLESTF_000632700 [Pleodorina starrii]